ncbi:hypothetical protein [Nocardiopsis tropica]|uniref:Uncharacterized protein n=1 Tax=Nocardiopsis tropica TaxID=109330 RepID=A0ABV1ZWU2_9ACTN|nr:hypothetical protein [Nocardiopsis tropica]
MGSSWTDHAHDRRTREPEETPDSARSRTAAPRCSAAPERSTAGARREAEGIRRLPNP